MNATRIFRTILDREFTCAIRGAPGARRISFGGETLKIDVREDGANIRWTAVSEGRPITGRGPAR